MYTIYIHEGSINWYCVMVSNHVDDMEREINKRLKIYAI